VTFDGVPAGIVSIASGAIRVTTPPHGQGPVTVVVTNPDLQSATKPGGFTYVPATPTGLAATGGQNQIALSWAAAPGADGYRVSRSSTSGGTYTLIGTSAGTTYTDAGLANGVRWFYVVQATSSAGTSATSNKANGWTLAAPPTGVTATPGARRVALAWSAATGATGYTVLRATVPGGPYTQVATPGGTTYTNTGLATGTTYYYVVRSRNAAGTGANSVEVSATAL
jgi:fibronectin type 3 domain-containing protein